MITKIFQEKSSVIDNIAITEDFYLIKFETFQKDVEILPGQFLNIRILNSLDPFLRRPFCIFDFEKNIISILFKVKGRGTELLSKLQQGDIIDFIFPLGNGFKEVFNKNNIWIIAGGLGVSGIFYLSKKLRNKNIELFVGFNTLNEANNIYKILKPILPVKNIHISVLEKQNKYFKGDILKLVQERLKNERPEIIAGCGPYEMLKSLHQLTNSLNLLTEFLMENQMACGLGACYGCAIPIKVNDRIEYKRVCKDGPVFRGDTIVWR